MPTVICKVFSNPQSSMVLVIIVNGISSVSLLGAWICCHGHDGCCLWCSCVHWWWVSEDLNWLMVAMVSLLVVVPLWYLWRWLWNGRLQCWSYDLPVPAVSGSRTGLNLIGCRCFLSCYPDDFLVVQSLVVL